MTTAVQHRRGTTAEHSTFTGLEGEVTIDTTKDTAVIHDGSLAGGYPLAKETLANVNPSTLSAITGAATASDDLFLMYDTSALAMKKISRAELNNAITIEALDTVDINGGTIDGTTIGGTTPAAGAFTSLSATSLTNTGNTTLGDASTDTVTVNGYMGVGGAVDTRALVSLAGNASVGGVDQWGLFANPTVTASATSTAYGVHTKFSTAAAAFTANIGAGVRVSDATKGAGSTITNQHGVYIADQTQGTNNYGITSLVSSGTNKWNIYASGTAANYFAGNVGIGNTNPAVFDQVASDDLVIGGGASNHGITIYSATNTSGGIAFADGTTTTDQYRGRLQYAHTDDSMRFFTSATEHARIDSSGNLLVGRTADSDLSTGTTISNAGWIRAVQTSTKSVFTLLNSTGALIEFRYATTSAAAVGSISTNGSSTSYNTSSDYRLKNSIAPMTGALAKVAALKPCTYKWNADGSDGEGFIAHELAEVCPQAVTGEKDAVDAEGNPIYQGIDTSFLVATLTAAIQEQQAIIDSLKSRLTAAGL